jgi:hypothetical protein
MNDFLSLIYDYYIHPRIEEKHLSSLSACVQGLSDAQAKLCVQAAEQYAACAFLLGVRAGAGLERYLQASPE